MEMLRAFWRKWKAFAHKLGRIQGVILLTLFYFLILGPVAICFRLLGKSPLPYHKKKASSYWHVKPPSTRGDIQYYQQF